jgi:hypothetical protein
MGHMPAAENRSKGPLGMTGVYTHATPATIRQQLEQAMHERPAIEVLRLRLKMRTPSGGSARVNACL